MDADDTEPRHLLTRSRRTNRWIIAAVATPVLVFVLVGIAWAVDTSRMGGKVLRNVELDGRDIGGLAEDDLPGVVAGVAEDFTSRPVAIVTPDAEYRTTAGKLGLAVDEDATVDAAFDVGRSETFPVRPLNWLTSFLSARDAPLRFAVTERMVRAELIELEGKARKAPVEPTIALEGDAFAAVSGTPGRGLDPSRVAALLPSAAEDADGGATIVVRIAPGSIAPLFDDDAAEDLAAEAARLSQEPITISAGGRSGEVPVDVLRSWFRAVPGDDRLELRLARDEVLGDLPEIVGGFDGGPRDARFIVEGGAVRLIAGENGTVCCAPDSPARILQALQAGDRSVELEVTTKEPELTTAEAEKLGIREEIGAPTEFGPTTAHPCCQSRVTNIHRIADLIRGAIIKPGETFSVNAYVGQRTRAKGFVPGGAIVNGRVDEQIGGGVSQFATTFFNAALYAGLEFGEYQSHSLYIDRYPRGHEATISWEHPDLQIKNPTPYGVLVWPTYTETTITVHLYSTKYYRSVTIGEPTSSPAGRCTRWTTPRSRQLPDGRTINDSVFARYRPAEGVNC